MNPLLEGSALYTRRQFFGRSALGVGTALDLGLQDLVAAFELMIQVLERCGLLQYPASHAAPESSRHE